MESLKSFWEFLDTPDIKIVIPKIQRDYAQGRIGKENLRSRFISSIVKSLVSKKSLVLDFVYGSQESDMSYYPLDGQQRLTTLWLLHWYIAFRLDLLADKSIREHLLRFSYQIRNSSELFTSRLCTLSHKEYLLYQSEVHSAVEDSQNSANLLTARRSHRRERDIYDRQLRRFIISRTWFVSAWLQDPTVSAMLNMICGTNIEGSDRCDIVDGLDEALGSYTNEELDEFWQLLTSESCPVRFYTLNVKSDSMQLTDDLYIKMNARGKALTDWENFKADLLGYVGGGVLGSEEQKRCMVELASQIDNRWGDIFWINHLESDDSQTNGRIDELCMAFVNRYILCEHLALTDSFSQKSQLFALYGDKSNDCDVEYKDFGRYRSDENSLASLHSKTRLPRLMERLYTLCRNGEQLSRFEDMLQCHWGAADRFYFIPRYQDGVVTAIKQAQRLVFYAVAQYLERVESLDSLDELDCVQFRDWVRFAWNISQYMRVEALDNAFKLIAMYADHCSDIVAYLATMPRPAKQSFAYEQVCEEIVKAKKIVSDSSFRDKIVAAEPTMGLNGRIACLFTDKNGEECWSDFDKKLTKLSTVVSADIKAKNRDFLRRYLSFCNCTEHILSENGRNRYIYDFDLEWWRSMLSDVGNAYPVHHILTQSVANPAVKFVGDSPILNQVYQWLLSSELMSLVEDKCCYLRRNPNYNLSLYRKGWGVMLEREQRDSILHSLTTDKLITIDNKTYYSPEFSRLFIVGWDVVFVYKEKSVVWSWDNFLKCQTRKVKIEETVGKSDIIAMLDKIITEE